MALLDIGQPATELLIDALRHESRLVRDSAAAILIEAVQIEGASVLEEIAEAAVEPFIEILRDKDRDAGTRVAAVWASLASASARSVDFSPCISLASNT